MIRSFVRSLLSVALLALVAMPAAAQVAPTLASGTSLLIPVTNGRYVQLWGFNFTQGVGAGFVALLNASAVPSASASIAPVECDAVGVAASLRFRETIADAFPLGLVMLSTSSCATYTAVTPAVMAALAR